MINNWIEGFMLHEPVAGRVSYKPQVSSVVNGKTFSLHFDDELREELTFEATKVFIDQSARFDYELLPVDEAIYLLNVHRLKENLKQSTYVLDFSQSLVTKIESAITEIDRDSTRLVEGTNLVIRDITFGYIIGDKIPCVRHHFTDELVDQGFAYVDSPYSKIHYHIHSPHKITYYQKVFPDFGNPIDKDGVGYGELDMVEINQDIILLTFTKHSHGNQPTLLWNRRNKRIASNFFGISRQQEKAFYVTGGGYGTQIY